jgi:uncharacterized protein
VRPIDIIAVWEPTAGQTGGLDGAQLSVLDASRRAVFTEENLRSEGPTQTLALSGDFTARVQNAAMTALSHVRSRDADSVALVAPFLAKPANRQAAVAALRRIPKESWPQAQLAPLADAIVSYIRAVPASARTGATFRQAVEIGRELAGRLPTADASRLNASLDEVSVRTIKIEAVVAQMKFDIRDFTVDAGEDVEILFVNQDHMPHNLLITIQGALETVSLKAEAMVKDPEAFAKHFVPDTREVLFATKLINHGETARLRFTAPQNPGGYPFVCTFPGHWRTMNGTMNVQRRAGTATAAAGRSLKDSRPAASRQVGRWASGEDLQEAVPHSYMEAGLAQPRSAEIRVARTAAAPVIASPAHATQDKHARQKAAAPHIVFVTGDDEYRSEITMPMIAAILEKAHGFRTSVAVATPRPQTKDNIQGLEALDTADLMVVYTRFRALPDEQLKRILAFAESGKPMIGLRTSTHAFQYPAESPYAYLNDGFGRDLFGQKWITHHGHRSSTDVAIHEANRAHPILHGVTPFHARSWLYHVEPLEGDGNTVLLDGTSIDSEKKPEQLPKYPLTQPVAWTREYKGARVFFTTLGHPEDFAQESMRRLVINAIYWALGRDVPSAGANAAVQGTYTAPETFDLSKVR